MIGRIQPDIRQKGAGTMTKEQAIRYIDLMDRRMFILTHSGVDWKPEYGPELEQINKELQQLRPLVDQEHRQRERKGENKHGKREDTGYYRSDGKKLHDTAGNSR